MIDDIKEFVHKEIPLERMKRSLKAIYNQYTLDEW